MPMNLALGYGLGSGGKAPPSGAPANAIKNDSGGYVRNDSNNYVLKES